MPDLKDCVCALLSRCINVMVLWALEVSVKSLSAWPYASQT